MAQRGGRRLPGADRHDRGPARRAGPARRGPLSAPRSPPYPDPMGKMKMTPPPRLGLLLLALVVLAASAPAQGGTEQILRIVAMPPKAESIDVRDLEGLVVDEDLLHAWRERRDMAIAAGVDILVFEITTPGGNWGTTRQILEDLLDLRHQGIRTVAFVPHHATSAGAVIAMGCGEVFLAPGAEIGNVVPLQMRDLGSFSEAPSKVVTEVTSVVKGQARAMGLPEELAAAMVNPDLEVVQVTRDGVSEFMLAEDYLRRFPERPEGASVRTLVPRGEALKITQDQAQLWSLPFGFAPDRNALPKALGLGDRDLRSEEVLEMPRPSRGGFLDDFFGSSPFRGIFSTLLLLAGIGLLVMEFHSPGLGVSGALGLLCLIGFFLLVAGDDLPMAGLASALVLLGFMLLLLEILFFPGFGLPGIAGIVLILFAIYAASVGLPGETLWDRLIPDSDEEWTRVQTWFIWFLGTAGLGTVTSLMLLPQLRHVPFLGKTFLSPPILETRGHASAAGAPGPSAPIGVVQLRVGALGVAETDLRPAGRARFAVGSVDVVTEGDWIPRGAPVQAILIAGNRVVVKLEGDAA